MQLTTKCFLIANSNNDNNYNTKNVNSQVYHKFLNSQMNSLVRSDKMASDIASGTEQDGIECVTSDSSVETNNETVQVEATAVKNKGVGWKYFMKVAIQLRWNQTPV